MTKLHICLGRNGDILNILSFLWHDAQTGEKPRLMVAAECSPLMEGVSYVDTVIYNGPHYEILKAIEQAKGMADEVIVCQTKGPKEAMPELAKMHKGKRPASNFCKESWQMAGRLPEWGNLYPLIFDKRDKEREARLVDKYGFKKKGRPTILLAMNSVSSPFPYPDLLKLVVETAGARCQARVVEIKNDAERIQDVIALYEQNVVCLVAIDSALLHLAWAVPKMPVIALAQDTPTYWHGSAWKPNMTFYCRYHDFPSRAGAMVEKIRQLRAGEILADTAMLQCWSEYEAKRTEKPIGEGLAFTTGICSRDSVTLKLSEARVPYLKDCLNMAIQKAHSDETLIVLHRPDTMIDVKEFTVKPPFYCYRMSLPNNERKAIAEFSPIADLFCASRRWWKSIMPEIPDVLLTRDFVWSQCLWAAFKKCEARDATGISFRVKKEPIPGTLGAAGRYNQAQCAAYLKSNRIYSRYPKVTEQCASVVIKGLPPFAYNPSLLRWKDGFLMTYRYHFDDTRNTKLGIAELDSGFAVLRHGAMPLTSEAQSYEDARLFSLHGEVWFSWTEAKDVNTASPTCVVKYAQLEEVPLYKKQPERWVISRVYQIASGANDWTTMQKNWVFFESDENLFCIYRSIPLLVVWQVQGEKVIAEHNQPGVQWPYGDIRGGGVIAIDGKLLRLFHSPLDNDPSTNRQRRYFIGAAVMEYKPPFTTLGVTKHPIIYGSEIDSLSPGERKSCKHFKPSVAIPYGLIDDGESVLAAIGVNDSSCVVSRIPKSKLPL
jgi:predicted GH43/DUF377 family glycosyl hydrolase